MESVSPTYADLLRGIDAISRKDLHLNHWPAIIHPSQWNGFIDVTHPSNIFAVTLRDLGRRLRCFRIYKMGLKVHTFIGLKYLHEMLDD